MSVRAVIFDWAGTTVDFGSRAPVQAFLTAFDAVGVTVTAEEVRVPMGAAKRDHIRAVLQLESVVARVGEAAGRSADESLIDEIYRHFLQRQTEVIAQHSGVIPSVPEVAQALAQRGIRIGSSTGYTRELMDVVEPLAAEAGFRAEFVATASDPCPGRPAPWMIYRNCEAFNVYPMRDVVKVDDTLVGIEAGRNAGCWTVGVAGTGNLMGLSKEEYDALPAADRQQRLRQIAFRFHEAGAHAVIESVADMLACLDSIERRIDAGALPNG